MCTEARIKDACKSVILDKFRFGHLQHWRYETKETEGDLLHPNKRSTDINSLNRISYSNHKIRISMVLSSSGIMLAVQKQEPDTESSESRPNSESPCNKHMQQSEAVQDKSHKQLVRTKGYLRICAKDGHMGDETAPVDGTLRRNRYSISQPSEDNPSEKFIKHVPPRCLHLRI